MMSNRYENSNSEIATFGAVHLTSTNLDRTTRFWTDVAGLQMRERTGDAVVLGTDRDPVVVVHGGARWPHRPGYTGLYHVAIHYPGPKEFALELHRLKTLGQPFSPVDHTMSQSLYLDDPDGISVELTLETPERFDRVTTEYGGMHIVDSEGRVRDASAPLDQRAVLAHIPENPGLTPAAPGTGVGHVHLAVAEIDPADAFYRRLGLVRFNHFPQFQYADLGSGGAYQHRVAMNSWRTRGRPTMPTDMAGMAHFELVFRSSAERDAALVNTPHTGDDRGAWLTDPAGNRVLVTS